MTSINASIFIFLAACHFAVAAPVPENQIANAYSGDAGNASGGSVIHNNAAGTRLLGGLGLIKLFSDNAGRGGFASSGPAIAKTPSAHRDGAKGDNLYSPGGNNNVGNAYSGAGGVADGGSVDDAGKDLITIFSDDAGDGGMANSGFAASGIKTLKSKKMSARPGPRMVSRSSRLWLD
ncbi:hypothetical protein GALMADRAFT_131566 [Galerina marginata CBS 339.88]|uniref:Uncharacterized protein n=1 Tax=Galerina marginata (strain CBS 339.88) TaxID=685588 RepID=A0A067TNF9_GALM3|nr:hypothetical protein GALMADRAFT_131566 [Galerina marginata CBS 339.88]